MAFTRKALAGLGLDEELIEKVMTLHGTSMGDFIPKSDLQAKIDAAVQDAQKNAPAPKIKESEEYKKLQGDFDAYKRKVETSGELKKGGVKDKFLDAVFSMLDSEKPAAEQLSAIREQYEEYFDADPKPEDKPKPQFGGNPEGSMPQGGDKGSLTNLWGFK